MVLSMKSKESKKTEHKQDLKRSRPNRDPGLLVMIVCEGEETEPNYFTGLRAAKRYPKDQIQVITPQESKGNDPKTLVKYAKSERAKAKNAGLPYDEVWCVFDRDEHQTFAQAIDQANANGIKLAISNPCFELWYLLHFQDQTARIDRNKLPSLLRKHIPNYEKSKPGICGIISDCQDDARRRAESLRRKHTGDGNSECENPSTGMDKLVKLLNTLRPRRRP